MLYVQQRYILSSTFSEFVCCTVVPESCLTNNSTSNLRQSRYTIKCKQDI
jgi:hypothetical protein